jgi:glucokinase
MSFSDSPEAANEDADGRSDPASQQKYWLGFDLGGTKMLASLADENFKVVGQKRRKTRSGSATDVPFSRIIETIHKCLDEHHVSPSQLAGIGIGCPGPVNWQKGIVPLAVNLGWGETPVQKLLEKEFDCPASVLNDVDAGVYGEYRFGAAKDTRCAVGLFPGTGIGGGCVYEDTILRGSLLTCMEVGHTRINSSPQKSGAPMSGTLESQASRLAIAAECAKLSFRGEAPTIQEMAGADIHRIRSKAIATAISRGDKAVEEVVRTAAREIGYAIANLVHLLSPDVFVLGGGLVEEMPKIFVDEVESIAVKNVLDCYKKTFKVRPAKLGDDAVVLGAAAWVAKEHPLPNEK